MHRPLVLILAFLMSMIPLVPAAMADARLDDAMRQGMAAVRSGDEARLRAAIGAVDDRAGRDLLLWHLIRGRQATFEEGEDFLARNPDWPGMELLRERVELDMPLTIPPDRIVAFFEDAPPATSRGALMQAVALAAEGRDTEAETTAIEAWLAMPMTEATETGFLDAFGNLLRLFDAPRLDAMTWAGDTGSAERAMARLSGPEAALARARIALREGHTGPNALIAAVPDALRDHPGLAYERFRWRLERGRVDDALELLYAHDAGPDTLGRPAAWGQHRERLARGLMQDGRVEDAYRVAARHYLSPESEDVAGLEWLAGYIALRFLNRPSDAAEHFRTFDAAVASPISKGRAGYWLGRALEAEGDDAGAAEAYREGARWQTSFYGQLAAERGNVAADPLLAGGETFGGWQETSFAAGSVFAAGRLLAGIGERELAERFLTHLAGSLPRAEIGSLIDFVLDDLDDPHVALLIAKRAAQAGHELHRGYFPLTALAEMASPVAPELALSIARRESEFDPVVVSRAGAAGLMQVMPGTAREMAGRLGIPYRQAALTSDPDYNARLGTAYLRELELEFGLSPLLVPAAYNAGPSRARAWSRALGDPADPAVDLVDWIEDVPFAETRNYIMRVAESLLPYRARLTGEPVEMRLTEWLRGGYSPLVR